jgi:hypothetical protein
MIQYVEIINFENQIRVVTKYEGATEFNEPIIIDVKTACISLDDILTEIKKHIE